jgi:hypothetical protein
MLTMIRRSSRLARVSKASFGIEKMNSDGGEIEAFDKDLKFEDATLTDDVPEIDSDSMKPLKSRNFKDNQKESMLKNFRISSLPREITERINFSNMKQTFMSSKSEIDKIPGLANKLDEIVQKPGIYRLSDMKDHIGEQRYQYLKNIPSPDEIDFSQIPPYNPPSLDTNLLNFAHNHKCKYLMSTSTISYFLSHLYYMLAGFKEANFSNMVTFREYERAKYMNAQKKPYTGFLRCVDKVNNKWALDGDSGVFTPHHLILIQMGKILERVYTMEPDHFNHTFLKDRQNLSLHAPLEDDYHRFMVLNDTICLRSQIDSKSTTNEGNIVFEIKSRALAPLRYDITQYEKYLDYSINSIYGEINSYEREYYDLIRGAFLKYYFQLKIGRMDGAFIGYHNTKENFGFEYVKTSTIEKLIFGGSFKADIAFMMATRILTFILDKVIDEIKNEDFKFIKLGYYADSLKNVFVVTAELMNDEYLELKNLVIDHVHGMENIVDYYDKVVGKKNLRVVRFETKLFPILNGIHNPLFYHDLQRGDSIEMECAFKNCGYISYEEYMHFLLNAYKYEYIMIDSTFAGNWMYRDKIFSDSTFPK